jgi:hypothetical protein
MKGPLVIISHCNAAPTVTIGAPPGVIVTAKIEWTRAVPTRTFT